VSSFNYFAQRTAAERYALGRPYLHPLIVQRVREITGTGRFAAVLDVGCGTGQSTRAVAEIAERTVGIDPSPEMLAQTTPGRGVEFREACAEELPFAESAFDLITVGLAFHWFDQEQFLAEAHRVLRPHAWLVIYNSAFGEIAENPEFRSWFRQEYLKRFPNTPRSLREITQNFLACFGFTLVQREVLTTAVAMTHEQFVNYLLAQSNVIAAVEHGAERLEDVAAWIADGTAAFFQHGTASLQFQIDIHFLRAA